MRLGLIEIIVVLALVLILFGAKLLPKFTEGAIGSMRAFKKAKQELKDEVTNSEDIAETKTEG